MEQNQYYQLYFLNLVITFATHCHPLYWLKGKTISVRLSLIVKIKKVLTKKSLQVFSNVTLKCFLWFEYLIIFIFWPKIEIFYGFIPKIGSVATIWFRTTARSPFHKNIRGRSIQLSSGLRPYWTYINYAVYFISTYAYVQHEWLVKIEQRTSKCPRSIRVAVIDKFVILQTACAADPISFRL